MIVAGQRQTSRVKASPIGVRPSKAGYAPAAYEIGKNIIQYYGYYKNVEPYLPDKYVDKYTYKPHKRVAGYLGQAFFKKKFRTSSGYKFYQERSRFRRWHEWYYTGRKYRKGRKHPTFDSLNRRVSRVSYQGNISYN